MPKYTVNYDTSELGWVVYADGEQITPGFSCESAADAWLDSHIKREEKQVEEILLGCENLNDGF
jgi:hypothetical protein